MSSLRVVAVTLPVPAQTQTLEECLRAFGDGSTCQLPRSGSYAYDCSYNQQSIACSGLKGSTVRWADGVVTKIWFVRQETDADRRRIKAKGSKMVSVRSKAIRTENRGGSSCSPTATPPG